MSAGRTLVNMDVLLTTAWLLLTVLGCLYTARQVHLAGADREN